jgi:hypothetical protein
MLHELILNAIDPVLGVMESHGIEVLGGVVIEEAFEDSIPSTHD